MTNNLETLKALALAATPGEWASVYEGSGDFQIIQIKNAERNVGHVWVHGEDYGLCTVSGPDSRMFGGQQSENNAAFIAAANPKTVIELIEVMEMMAEALKSCDDAGGMHELYHDASLVEKALARFEALTSHPPPAF